MSIRFKFRSCMNFDSVDIDGQPSISLWELRLKIARQKKLNIGVDIDLIFFDALSEQEYNDENLQIASGSSVIVKRVPVGTMPSTVKCQYQKLDSRGLNQRGTNHSKIPTKLPEPKTPDAWTSLHKVICSNFPNNVFVELKCSLCNTFFKDAVMIPCCQHSFYDKCIRLALLEKAKCPKCSSSRFRVEDLLPNLSLRQAIAHLESQMVDSEKALRRHVPDGESGIQGKDFSCAVIVVQWEPEKEMPQSPSASGKGSNLVMAESLSRTRSIDGGQGQYANHWDIPENCEGDRKPLNFLHSHVQEEGGNMKFLPTGTVEKVRLNFCQHAYYRFMVTPDMQPGKLPLCQGYIQAKYLYMDRNCYVCGTPDHLIRDCPLASNPNPMLQTGNDMLYPSPYWNNNTYSTLRPPLENMYANAGNAPFNASMVPPTPYVHPYMQSMHAGMPLHGGIMRMGGMALPAGNRDELPLNQYEYMGLQLAEDKRRIQNEKMGRSNDGFPSSSDRHRRESHLHHSRDSRKRGSHHNHLPSSALEPTSPVHQAPRSKERRGFGHDAKQSRHHARNSTDEVRDYKKWTSSGSYEDCRDGYHHKRKRVH